MATYTLTYIMLYNYGCMNTFSGKVFVWSPDMKAEVEASRTWQTASRPICWRGNSHMNSTLNATGVYHFKFVEWIPTVFYLCKSLSAKTVNVSTVSKNWLEPWYEVSHHSVCRAKAVVPKHLEAACHSGAPISSTVQQLKLMSLLHGASKAVGLQATSSGARV